MLWCLCRSSTVQPALFCPVWAFDREFFAYLEDVDINFRARRLGLGCMYIAGAVVFHIGSASSGSKINPFTIRLSTRDNLLVLMKNFEALLLLRFFPAIIVYQLAWLLFCLKKGMLLPYLHGLREAAPRLSRLSARGATLLNITELFCLGRSLPRLSWRRKRRRSPRSWHDGAAEGKGNLLLCCYRRLFL